MSVDTAPMSVDTATVTLPGGVPTAAELDQLVAGTRQLLELVQRGGVRRLAVSVGAVSWELECGPAAPEGTVTLVTPAVAAAAPGASPAGAHEVTAAPAAAHQVIAPLVGVFYRSPAPGKAPFVAEGDRVEAGQTVAIVEAMKMMNEVVADHAGTVTAVHAGDGEIVEYGQLLFTVAAD